MTVQASPAARSAAVAPFALAARLSRASSAFWRRRSVRAQLLIAFVAIEAIAALLMGGVTILHARKSTRLEIAASLRMAEVLVGETAALTRQDRSAEQFLMTLPVQLRHVRHVRISVADAAGRPVTSATAPGAVDVRAEDRAAAPAWFAAMIAPPPQS